MEFPRALDPFRALSASFRVLGAAAGPILVGGILLTILGSPRTKIGIGLDEDFEIAREALPLFLGLGCCFGLAFFLLESWISIGYARAVEEVERRGTTTLGRVFESDGRFGDMVLARLLTVALTLAIALPWGLVALGCAVLENALDAPDELVATFGVLGFLVYLPVAIYLLLGLCFVTQAVALDGASPTRAISRSWEFARGRRLALFFFALVNGVFAFAGFCLCCIGLFLTAPLSIAAWSDAYLALTREPERRGWWIEGGRPSESSSVGARSEVPASAPPPSPSSAPSAPSMPPPTSTPGPSDAPPSI